MSRRNCLSLTIILMFVAGPVVLSAEDTDVTLLSSALGISEDTLVRALTQFPEETDQEELVREVRAFADLGVDPLQSVEFAVKRMVREREGAGTVPLESLLDTAVALKLEGVGVEGLLLVAEAQALRLRAEGAEDQQKIESQRDFLGIQWNLAIALSVDLSDGERVKSASLVNDIVRVDEENRAQPRMLWEVHKLWGLDKDPENVCEPDGPCIEAHTKGMGLFVGIQSSQDDLIDSFATGLMFGWRRNTSTEVGFNVGLGVVYDPGVQVLGDGIVANEPLPDGETEIRYKKEDRWGGLLMFSFRF